MRERPKTLSPLWGLEAGFFSFPLVSSHFLPFRFIRASIVRRRAPSTPLLCAQDRPPSTPFLCAQDRPFDSVSLRSGQALRLRFSALRTGPSTPFLCAQDRPFDSVSLRSGQALRLRFSALRTGPSTPFLCAQDRPFDSVSLRSGQALRLRFSALRTGPLRRGSGQALRLRFSALRMRGGIIRLTIIIVERWHPEWEGGKCQYVSCCCHRRRRDRRLCGCTKNNRTGEGKLKDPARRGRTIVKSFNTVESAFNPTFPATPENRHPRRHPRESGGGNLVKTMRGNRVIQTER